jgi:acyl-ACP thioesterase
VTSPDDNAHSGSFHVRFDEAGPDGHIRTSVLLRYAQDLAWADSEGRGFDREWYGERGLTWLVRAAELRIEGPIPVGITLSGTTRVIGWRRVWSRRRTTFQAPDGTTVAWIHIDWLLLDAQGAPTRIPPEFYAAFDVPVATFPLGRVALEPAPTDASRRTVAVRPQELDPMDHVNNAVYADWLEEAVIAAGDTMATRAIPRRLRIEYAWSAEPGAVLTAQTWADEAGWSYRLTDADDRELIRARLDRD